ncbi:MAG: hypothetical protein NTX59_12480 [Elusimicrobia bacterium]|nr:hypothetical protein [Elusimicrobiota bacterium]
MKSEVCFLSAPVNSGKTAFIKRLLKALKEKRIKTGGVYAIKEFKGSSRLYRVFDILSGKSVPLLEVSNGVIAASKAGFSFASKAILQAKGCEVAIIDEFGPLEVSGYGYAAAVKKLIKSRNMKIFIVVRKGLCKQAAASLNLKKYAVIKAEKVNYKKVLGLLLS